MSELTNKREELVWRYYDKWIHLFKEGQVTSITFCKYLNTGKWLKKLMPHTKMKQLDRATMQEFFNEFAKTHERQTAKDLKNNIGASIVDAVDEHILDRNPMIRVRVSGKRPTREHRQKYLEQDELEAVVEQMDLSGSAPTMDKLLFLLAKTGMRFAEGLGLTPEDFDLDHLTLSINKTWDYRDAEGGFMPTKTTSSVRTISIDYRTARVMDRVIEASTPGKPIFVQGRVFNATYNRHLKLLCQDAGVPVISVHGLRHTHASILIANKVPMAVVSKRLGHAKVSITQDVYTHLLKTTEKDADKQIATLMSAIG